MGALTREEILNTGLRTKKITVAAWGGDIWVRELTALQQQEQSRNILGGGGKPDYKKAAEIPTRLVITQVISEDGTRIFSDDDIHQVERQSADAIRFVADEIRKLSGIKRQGGDDLQEWLEENHPDILTQYEDESNPVRVAEVNFTETPNGDSPSH